MDRIDVSSIGTPQFWVALAQIVVVNILLSGDTAVMIALACRDLPERERRVGMFWGVLGAVAMRTGLAYCAMTVLAYPYLKLLGAALLAWLGIKVSATESRAQHAIRGGRHLFAIVSTIILADAAMSLDNVLAVVAAAKGNVLLIAFGLIGSIPMVALGSQLIVRLLRDHPLLVRAGGALLGYIAGEIALDDPALTVWIATAPRHLAKVAPLVTGALVMAVGAYASHRRRAMKPRGNSLLGVPS